MADDIVVLADFVADALDVDPTETSNVLNRAPLVSRMPVTDTSDGGVSHKYNVHTGDPLTGFRAENAGRDYDHSVDTVTTVTCKILDFSFKVDYANANAWRRGAEDYIAREGLRHLASALFTVEQQVFYGTTSPGDSAGFTGLLDSTDLDALADTMVIGGGGTTASEQSSVYGLRLGFDDCRLVIPKNQGIMLGETIVQESGDGAGLTSYPVYYTPASMYIGFAKGGTYSAGRVANISTTTDSKPLTTDMISDMLAQFRANQWPDVICMNKTRWKDLQQGATATNPTGREAPFPETVFGIPIIVTDALVDTEAVEV